MTFSSMVHRSKDHGFPRALSAVALSLVLIVIAYGIARPPDVLSSSESALAAQASTKSTLGPGGDSAHPGSAVPQSRFVVSDPPTVGVDSARECAPAAGVTDACIFN